MAYGQVVADTHIDSYNALLAPISVPFRNRLIDAGFIINQRVYVSGTALSSGTYAHDRWKAGASGCTYTFTQLSQGVPIVITITAGSLQQVIEGCNMPEGGTYVLSWTGTAQARFNGGSYGSSPLAITGLTAGANLTIEFNTGTLSYPQIERGSNATSFDYRPYTTELQLCQRYLPCLNSTSTFDTGGGAFCANASAGRGFIEFKVTPRVAPTGITVSSASHFVLSAGPNFTPSAVTFYGASLGQAVIGMTISGATANVPGFWWFQSASGQILFTGCEL